MLSGVPADLRDIPQVLADLRDLLLYLRNDARRVAAFGRNRTRREYIFLNGMDILAKHDWI